MVERPEELDSIFGALSDPTRRDILRKVSKQSLSVSEIAAHYSLSFAAVAKHVDVLHRAHLVSKSRRGKEQIVSITPDTLAAATDFLETYKKIWENRLDSLDKYLETINKNNVTKSNVTKSNVTKSNVTKSNVTKNDVNKNRKGKR